MKNHPNTLKTLGLCLLASSSMAAEPTAIIAKLQSPAPGIEPAVLYLDSAETNSGQGGSGLVATWGEKLSGQGRDPWGNSTGAFGPAAGAKLGAAIVDSDKTELMAGESGAVVMCVKIPAGHTDSLILSRGSWGDHGIFDVRTTSNQDLLVWISSDGESEPKEFNLGRYTTDEWVFIGMSWQMDGSGPLLETCVAPLQFGATPESKSFAVPAVGNPTKLVQIGGRTNPDLARVVMEGGLYWGLGIYEKPLSLEVMEDLVQAMQEEVKP